MPSTFWFRLTMWLERFAMIRPALLLYDGEAPFGKRYVNRANGHLVVLTPDGKLI